MVLGSMLTSSPVAINEKGYASSDSVDVDDGPAASVSEAAVVSIVVKSFVTGTSVSSVPVGDADVCIPPAGIVTFLMQSFQFVNSLISFLETQAVSPQCSKTNTDSALSEWVTPLNESSGPINHSRLNFRRRHRILDTVVGPMFSIGSPLRWDTPTKPIIRPKLEIHPRADLSDWQVKYLCATLDPVSIPNRGCDGSWLFRSYLLQALILARPLRSLTPEPREQINV